MDEYAIDDTEPPCATCAKPELLPENDLPYEIFGLVYDQYVSVSGLSGIAIGLRCEAIKAVLDLMGIENEDDRWYLFMVVTSAHRHVTGMLAKKRLDEINS